MHSEAGDIDRLMDVVEKEKPCQLDILHGMLSAIENDHFHIFQCLMPFSDLSNITLLQRAAVHERQNMFDILYPLCDSRRAYEEFRTKWSNTDGGVAMFEQRFHSEQERALLVEATQDHLNNPAPKTQKM